MQSKANKIKDKTTMDFVNLMIGFVLGIVSSWVFWYVLVLTKPKIAISLFVALDLRSGKLRIKVVNRARRQAVDIQARIWVAERVAEHLSTTIYRPDLQSDYRFALASTQNMYDEPWSLPTVTSFITDEGKEILNLLSLSGKGERRLVFTLSAADALSGSKVVERVTYGLEDVKFGRWKVGPKFEIDETIADDSQDEATTEDQTTLRDTAA